MVEKTTTKKRIQGKGEGDDKTWSKTVIQRGIWYGHISAHVYTHTYTQAISLITSDRDGAKGSNYSHGHFHCGTPLATCPIYAFNTHAHTQAHSPHKLAHISSQKQPHLNMLTKHTCLHGHREKENEITWLVLLSFTVIQHHGQKHMCSNRDKTQTHWFSLLLPRTQTHTLKRCQILGHKPSEYFNWMCVFTD